MPTFVKYDEQPTTSTVGMLPSWDIHTDSSKAVREVLALLDQNTHFPGVLVIEQGNLIGLIPREKVYEKLGRPYGVELFLKMSIKNFYKILEISSLVLPADTPIDEAVKIALSRKNQILYDPIVIADPTGYHFVTMYSLLTAQQDHLQDLYSEVRYLSSKDPLTLVNNRRGFFEEVNQKLVTIRHFDLNYATLMFDIDHFKNVNDRYGHIVGDEIIRNVAQQIYSSIREKDVMGRFGGEEFVVFLNDMSKEASLELAEVIREDIASKFHTVNGFQIRVTVSIGLSISKGTNSTFDAILKQADQAMFAAKNSGRNKVLFWEENLNRPENGYRVISTVRRDPISPPEHLLDQMVYGLLHMLYLRDYETEGHTLRVSNLTGKLAEKMGISGEKFEEIRIGALLHDIGKIGVPDEILFKKDKLTDVEWAIMKKHPQHAHDLMSPIAYFQHALEIPYCHHEHWDGTGYPRGLRAEEIPLVARIFTIVDVWDALSSDRTYRPAWQHDEIIEYLLQQSGLLFDPEIVPIFIDLVTEGDTIKV